MVETFNAVRRYTKWATLVISCSVGFLGALVMKGKSRRVLKHARVEDY